MGTLRAMHLTDGLVIFWICIALCVGWGANDGLRRLWYGALDVADEAAQWGVAASAAIGLIAVIDGGIAMHNGWRPSW